MYSVYQANAAAPAASPQASALDKAKDQRSPSSATTHPESAPKPQQTTQSHAAQNPAATANQAIPPDTQPMPVTTGPILWIGFGFTTALVLLGIVTLWFPPKRGSQGRAAMRLLMSLCAAFAGGFLTGAAIFNGSFTHALGKVSISGSAGIALFLTVFFFYDNKPDDGEIDIENGITITIPPSCKFRDVADIVAAQAQAGIDYRVLNANELDADMKAQPVTAKSREQLLESLRNVTVLQAIRPYTVKKENGSFVFKL